MFHQLIIVGNLGSDPELKYLDNGTAVANFSVAVNEVWYKDKEKKERTTWYRVNVWRRQAETCSEYLSKGSQVMVVGRPSANAWVGADGEPRAQLELTAQTVKFMGGRGGGDDNYRDVDNNHPSAMDGFEF
jgi:single-strand DNA-binding protein